MLQLKRPLGVLGRLAVELHALPCKRICAGSKQLKEAGGRMQDAGLRRLPRRDRGARAGLPGGTEALARCFDGRHVRSEKFFELVDM